MLTNHAFNSMLKTLEEPPEHVKFILATTDPQKIPVTVLSRCLQFNLKQMPPGHIVGHLEYVLGEEKIAYEATALRLLAKAAQGSMRDALSLTDQAIAYSAGSVTEAEVRGMLGSLDQSYLVRICDALVAEDGATLLSIADEMAERSLSFSAALQDLSALLHKVALAQTVPAAVQDDWPEAADVRRLAQSLDAQEVQLFYQIANQGRHDIALAPDEYAGFTMALLRMLAFRPSALGSTLNSQNAGNAATQVSPVPSKPNPARTAALAVSPAAGLAAPTIAVPAVKPSAARAAALSSPSPVGKARSPLEAAQRAMERAATRQAPVAQPTSPKVAPVVVADAMPESEIPPWMDMEEGAPTVRSVPATTSEAASPVQVTAIATTAAPSVRERLQNVSSQLTVDAWPAFDGNWPALVEQLSNSGLAQELARQAELQKVEFDGQVPTFYLHAPVRQVTEGGAIERLQVSLTEYFATKVKVVVDIDAKAGDIRLTAANVIAEVKAEKLVEAETALRQDPFIQTLQRDFGASIVPGSIQAR